MPSIQCNCILLLLTFYWCTRVNDTIAPLQDWTPESEVLLRSLLDHPQVVAVGECGLDYFRMLSSTNKQLEAFEDQVGVHFCMYIHNVSLQILLCNLFLGSID